MPYLCKFAKSGTSYISAIAPENTDFFERVTHFDTYDDAETARMMVESVTRNIANDADKAIIAALTKRIDELTDDRESEYKKVEKLAEVIKRQDMVIRSLELSLQGAKNILENAFQAIARDLVISGTHRERNALYRSIARIMDNW